MPPSDVSSSSGFHAASMAHIAQTADMSAGLIYRYFASKAAIVKAIIERHLEIGSTSDRSTGSTRQRTSASDAPDLFDAWRSAAMIRKSTPA